MADSPTIDVYTDASRGETIIGISYRIVIDESIAVADSKYLCGSYTSMEAEYIALIEGIRVASLRFSDSEIMVYTDCKPLVEKMRIPDSNSHEWYNRRKGCHWLLNKFEDWEMEWIPRKENTDCDRLAKEELWRGLENNP